MTDELEGPTGPIAADAPARDRARLAAAVADDKKGLDTVILDVGDVLAICELFVITSAPNTRLVRTIAEDIERLEGRWLELSTRIDELGEAA